MGVSLFRVEKPGLLTTVQDLGRAGRQREGMVVAGAMDPFAAQVANLLVGNPRGEAVLEITLTGPTLSVLSDVTLAVCGADLTAQVDGAPIPLWKTVRARRGQTVQFGRRRAGARACLAVAGGFDVPVVLGSKSTFLRGKIGGLDGRALRAGDVLEGPHPLPVPLRAGRGLASGIPAYAGGAVARVVPGPHEDAFSPAGIATFLSSAYTLTSRSDRMGCRLEGPAIEHAPGRSADILSEAAAFGAVQVPSDGQPIILMADRQTTGGYTQIATVISVDLPQIAQLAPGDSVSFHAVSVEEAQELWVRQEGFFVLLEGASVQ